MLIKDRFFLLNMNVVSFFTRQNFYIHRIQHIEKTGKLTDVQFLKVPCIVTYEYNVQKHKHLLTQLSWPPTFSKGFMVPIKKITYKGKDITENLSPFFGPRKTDIHCIFIKRKPVFSFHNLGIRFTIGEFIVPYWKGEIEIEDIFSRTRRCEVEFNLSKICD